MRLTPVVVFDKLLTACASAISVASTVSSDPQGAANKICSDKTCLSAMASIMEKQPDCTVMGENFKDRFFGQFSLLQKACKSIGVNVDTSRTLVSTTTSTPPSASSSASTTAMGLSAAVTAVVVLAQL